MSVVREKLLTKNKQGFTLIELVIVLAIAALILAGIFVAVTGAQKSRRDTQRKNDAANIASLLEQSSSNFNGSYPGTAGGDTVPLFNGKYLSAANTNMRDPSTGAIYAVPAPAGGVTACPAAGVAGTISYAVLGRKYQICMSLESGDNAPFRN